MMTRHYNFEIESIYIVLLTLFSVLLSTLFFIDSALPPLFNPVLGFAFAFAILFDNKAYLPILFGSILGWFVVYIFMIQLSLLESLLLSVALTTIMIGQIQLARKISIHYKLDALLSGLSFTHVITNLLLGLFISGIGALFIAVFYVGIGDLSNHYWLVVNYAFTANIFGLLLFTLPTVWSWVERKITPLNYSKEKLMYIGVIALTYLLIMFLLVTDIILVSIRTDFYIILVFYLIIALILSYRLINVFTISFLIIVGLYIESNVDAASRFYYMVTFLSFVTFGTLLSLLIKQIMTVKKQQIEDINMKNKTVDRLITDIYELLTFSSTFIEAPSNEDYMSHIRKTLDIALRLVHDASSGYCYLEKDGAIDVVAATSYNHHDIPYLYDAHVVFGKQDDDVYITDNIACTLKQRYGKNYGLLMDIEYPVAARAMLKFNYKKQDTFVVVIDKYEGQDSFTAEQSAYLKQFVSLVNILFTRSYYQAHNLSLKDEIVLQFVRSLDLFDAYTKGHSEDVAYFVSAIAKELALPADERQNYYWGGILHDVGKVGVPSDILNKPDKLTKEEYKVVKEHATYGYNILKQSKNLKMIALFVKHHHEWWNGKGYPDGLKAHDIPLGSQIIGVADMIATMATKRAYRDVQTKARILDELKTYKGTQFAPKIVDIALVLIEDNDILAKRYPNFF